MEHYEKGQVIEVEDPDGPFIHMGIRFGDVTTMKVRNGSKIRNLLTFATKKLKEDAAKSIIFTGTGSAVTKTVTCVEIMKRQTKNLHQLNKAYYRRTEEYWEPKEEGLDRLKVNRQVPALAILLSKDPLDKNEPGYQAPGSFEANRTESARQDKRQKNIQKHGESQRQRQSQPKAQDARKTQGSMSSNERPNKRRDQRDRRKDGKRKQTGDGQKRGNERKTEGRPNREGQKATGESKAKEPQRDESKESKMDTD